MPNRLPGLSARERFVKLLSRKFVILITLGGDDDRTDYRSPIACFARSAKGMGAVYEAIHPQIERKVAIKVLHPGMR